MDPQTTPQHTILRSIIQKVLEYLAVVAVSALLAWLSTHFKPGWFQDLTDGVPRAKFESLVARVDELEKRPLPPPLPSDVLHSGDKISIKYRISNNGTASPGWISIVPPSQFGTTTIGAVNWVGENEMFNVEKH